MFSLHDNLLEFTEKSATMRLAQFRTILRFHCTQDARPMVLVGSEDNFIPQKRTQLN